MRDTKQVGLATGKVSSLRGLRLSPARGGKHQLLWDLWDRRPCPSARLPVQSGAGWSRMGRVVAALDSGEDLWRRRSGCSRSGRACGNCGPCSKGDPACCHAHFLAMNGRGPNAPAHGGFATAISIDSGRLFTVPAAVNDVEAAILRK